MLILDKMTEFYNNTILLFEAQIKEQSNTLLLLMKREKQEILKLRNKFIQQEFLNKRHLGMGYNKKAFELNKQFQ